MLIGHGANSQGSALNTITVSATPPVNDESEIVLAHVFGAFSNALITPTIPSPPAGWNLSPEGESVNAGNGTSSGFAFPITAFYALFWRAGPVPIAPVSFTFNNTSSAKSFLFLFLDVLTGADTVTSLEAAGKNGTTGTSHSVTGGTTTLNDCLLIAAWSGVDNTFQSFNNPIEFIPPATMNAGVSTSGRVGSLPDLLAWGFQVAEQFKSSAGAIGSRTATSNGSNAGLECASHIAAIRPYQGPSKPDVIKPATGETITKGINYTLQTNPATDPDTPQGNLTYTWEYSSNNGISWTAIGTGAAGVLTMAWNTAALATGTSYRIRCRASDGVNTGFWDVTGAFTIAADVIPGPPTMLLPNGGVLDRQQNQTISWLFNDTGDVQTERTWEWGTDGSTFPNVSTLATADMTIAITGGAGILASRGQKFHRVKVKDNAGNASVYSDVSNFLAGDKPATPNLTAPTFASPPTQSFPTFTFTSASAFTHRRLRLMQGGQEVFNSGIVASTSLSFTIGYGLSDGLEYTAFLSVLGTDGLWSDEDSETFTPAFTGPAQPTIEATGDNTLGAIQIAVTNSDTVDRNEIWRREQGQAASAAIRLTKTLAEDGTFIDFLVKSNVTYVYFARAYNVSDLFTDSAEDSASVALVRLHLNVATKSESTSNSTATLSVSLDNQAPMDYKKEVVRGRDMFVGRTKPTTAFTQSSKQSLRTDVIIRNISFSEMRILRAIYEANGDLFIRDQFGNGFFTKLINLPETDSFFVLNTILDLSESHYDPHVS